MNLTYLKGSLNLKKVEVKTSAIIVFVLCLFNTSLNAINVYNFEYQLGISTNNETYTNLKGDLFVIHNMKVGTEMAFFKDEYRTDFGIYFQMNPIKNFLISINLGSSYMNETSISAIGTTLNYIIPITEETLSLGVNYRYYDFDYSKTIFFLGFRY
jgi:hypothetical protein